MKGLVLAGGSGTRLRPLTYSGAKQLVPVANRPILFYVIDNLVKAGIHEIGVIVSPETGAAVEAAVLGEKRRGAWNATFSFLLQEQPRGLAHAVLTASAFLGDDDFCMYLGDNLIGASIADAVRAFEMRKEVEASVMLKEVANPQQFGVAEVDEHGNVVGLVEKPQQPKSDLALVGIYLFRRSIFTAIDRIRPSPRGELEITDAISMLLTMGKRVRFDRIDAWWLDTGKKDDLLAANETVLRDWLRHDVQGDVDAATVVEGEVRIEAGAVIRRSTLRGPLTIGAGAVIEDAILDPFCSIGDGCRVEGARVVRSVLLEASRVSGVGTIENSILGRRAVVRLDGATHELFVGDDSSIVIKR